MLLYGPKSLSWDERAEKWGWPDDEVKIRTYMFCNDDVGC